MDEASTHCELDPEFHVRQTGQIYKAAHFSARNLCSEENHKKHSNLCAGVGIIGPISDLEHTSNKAVDMQDEEMGLEEDEAFDSVDYVKMTPEEWLNKQADLDADYDDEDDEDWGESEYDSEDYDDEDDYDDEYDEEMMDWLDDYFDDDMFDLEEDEDEDMTPEERAVRKEAYEARTKQMQEDLMHFKTNVEKKQEERVKAREEELDASKTADEKKAGDDTTTTEPPGQNRRRRMLKS